MTPEFEAGMELGVFIGIMIGFLISSLTYFLCVERKP